MPIQGYLGVAGGVSMACLAVVMVWLWWPRHSGCGPNIATGTIKQTQTSQPHFLRFNRGELGTRGAPPYLINRLHPGEVAMFGRDSIRRRGYAWRGVVERCRCGSAIGCC